MKKLLLALLTLASLVSAPSVGWAQCNGQFSQNQVCGYAGVAPKGNPGPIAITPGVLNPISGGTVLGNPTVAAAAPQATNAPVLGVPGSLIGSIGFAGNVSGKATVIAQSEAGSPTLTLPNTSGTLVSNTTSFFAIDATTGQLSVVGILPLASGGTNANLIASNGGIFYSTATAGAILAGSTTARQMLQSGASSAPAWSTATWPATTVAGTVLASGSTNNVVGTSTPVLGASGTLGSITFGNATSGLVTLQPVAGALGTITVAIPSTAGTMAVSASSPLVLNAISGVLTCPTCATSLSPSGAALTAGNDTNVTLSLGGSPSTALLNATSITAGWAGQLSLTRGGTNASLTASNGGLVYSTASALAILSGTATANQIPLSGPNSAPSWSTATYPATASPGTVLATTSANVIAATAQPVLGANGGSGGQITLNGSGSGSAVISVAAAAGSVAFQLPTTNGSNTNVLSTDGLGHTSWAAAGSGTVTSLICGTGLTGGTITTTGTCAVDIASTSNIWSATANKILDAGNVFNGAGTLNSCSGTSTITCDFSTGFNFTYTATSATNYTLANPTNATRVGQQGCIYAKQPASGTVVTITFGSNWTTAGGVSGKALTATLGATDRICYLVTASGVADFTLANNITH